MQSHKVENCRCLRYNMINIQKKKGMSVWLV